ncbi:ComF family protein [Desulfobacula phenolica]|uniref:ComF family protein n=1 Tax=Desulfobacula phenolica TaxID=90732 RepID=A0A1H2GSF7_9BACT|nr:ComF family protein [Desulfobacula phenolica]SDU22248.1 comF family protein [Desulfobacula phenolica]
MFKIFKACCKTCFKVSDKICSRAYYISVVKKSIRLFGQLLYPLKCLKCGAYIDSDELDPYSMETCFCDQCMAAGFYPMETPFCIKCGVKFPWIFDENCLCQDCLKNPLMLEQVRAVAEYKGIIKDAVPLFKYHSKLAVSKVFEHLMFQAFLRYYESAGVDLIMPVPLHKKKLKQRGFNQAFFLIRNFVKQYRQNFDCLPSWKIDTNSLVRFKQTPSQTELDMEQRKINLKNAFKVVAPATIDKKHILLIDDVFTTGATCNEAAKELLNHGAGKVTALVLART